MTRRGLIAALLVSVALNCALLGLLVGDRYLGRAKVVGDVTATRIAEIVPPRSRPAVRQALREHRFELLRTLREVRRAKLEVKRYAGQQPPARAELAQSLAALRAATAQAQMLVHTAVLEGLAAESPAPMPESADGAD